MSENNLKIRKILINEFVEVLISLYDKGVDYVDLIANTADEIDVIGISFCKEYMSEGYRENFDKISETKFQNVNIDINLSDDTDLNQLI